MQINKYDNYINNHILSAWCPGMVIIIIIINDNNNNIDNQTPSA